MKISKSSDPSDMLGHGDSRSSAGLRNSTEPQGTICSSLSNKGMSSCSPGKSEAAR